MFSELIELLENIKRDFCNFKLDMAYRNEIGSMKSFAQELKKDFNLIKKAIKKYVNG